MVSAKEGVMRKFEFLCCLILLLTSFGCESLCRLGGVHGQTKRVPAAEALQGLSLNFQGPSQPPPLPGKILSIEFPEKNVTIKRGDQFEVTLWLTLERGIVLSYAKLSLNSSAVSEKIEHQSEASKIVRNESIKKLARDNNMYAVRFLFPTQVFPRGDVFLKRLFVIFENGSQEREVLYEEDFEKMGLENLKFTVVSNDNSVDIEGPQVSDIKFTKQDVMVDSRGDKFTVKLQFKAVDDSEVGRVYLNLGTTGSGFAEALCYPPAPTLDNSARTIKNLGGGEYEAEFEFDVSGTGTVFLNRRRIVVCYLSFVDVFRNSTSFILHTGSSSLQPVQ